MLECYAGQLGRDIRRVGACGYGLRSQLLCRGETHRIAEKCVAGFSCFSVPKTSNATSAPRHADEPPPTSYIMHRIGIVVYGREWENLKTYKNAG